MYSVQSVLSLLLVTCAFNLLQAASQDAVLHLSDLAKDSVELELLKSLSLSEDDPPGLFSWNDAAVARFHAAAAAIPVMLINPLFAITATPAGFKVALLHYLAARLPPAPLCLLKAL